MNSMTAQNIKDPFHNLLMWSQTYSLNQIVTLLESTWF